MGSPRIALLGLGEAGSLIAADLAAAGAAVVAYDPQPRNVPSDVLSAASEAAAAREADVVMSVNWSWASKEAASAALPGLASGAVYAELNTSSPALKREVAELVAPSGALFADVALMSNVPGKGLRTPMLAAGPGAQRFAELLTPLGAQIEDEQIARIEAIISSMTEKERANPRVLDASRRRRIAKGSGTQVQDINRLVKNYEEMRKLMKRMGRGGPGRAGRRPSLGRG